MIILILLFFFLFILIAVTLLFGRKAGIKMLWGTVFAVVGLLVFAYAGVIVVSVIAVASHVVMALVRN